jgi:predicted site-specific integrase-resolvase
MRKLVKVAAIAANLNESPFTIERWRKEGLIPFFKLGYRTYRYDFESVMAALSRLKVQPVGGSAKATGATRRRK